MIVAAVAVLGGIAIVSMGYGGELAAVGPRRPGLGLPAGRRLTPADLEELHLSVGVWGYPPGQVEELVRRAARALAERDAYIAELERRLSGPGRGDAPPVDRSGRDGEEP